MIEMQNLFTEKVVLVDPKDVVETVVSPRNFMINNQTFTGEQYRYRFTNLDGWYCHTSRNSIEELIKNTFIE